MRWATGIGRRRLLIWGATVEALARVCAFLGVATDAVQELPAENVTAHIDEGFVNNALHKVVQNVETYGGLAPAPLRHLARSLAVKLPQREQRTRQPLTFEDRSLLLPHFSADIKLLEEVTGRSFAHWRDPDNGITRRALDIEGRFGTAFRSIDQPVMR